MANADKEKDPRPGLLMKIGCMGLGMLALCIPLCGIIGYFAPKEVFILPIAAIAGTGVTMLIIWFSPVRKREDDRFTAMQKRLDELHERVSNLEMMDSFERRIAQRASQPTAAPPPPATGTEAPAEDTGRMMRPDGGGVSSEQ